ncbi:hypothetical protein Tco_1078587 [Tanacetum coccineum]|uniref:MAK10-like protein n=1 Tax=Tanacetum coccineum TaxID=301880 RepID=A0ABQ5HR09_9ASTR
MGDENPIFTLGDYSKPSHEGYTNTIELSEGNNVVPLRSDTIWLVQNGCSIHGLRSEDPNQHLKDFLKLMDSLNLDVANRERTRLNAEESWALLEDLALYNNESWNNPKDFAKPVKAISLPQDILSTSGRHLIELENQVQRLMEAHLTSKQPVQVNKISFSCEICSGPHNIQYFMENPKQAFVEYASSRTDEAGDARLSKFEANFKQQEGKMTNKIDTVLKAITDRITGALPSDMIKNLKLNVNSIAPILSARSCPMKDPQCSNHIYSSINTIKTCSKETSDSQKDQLQTFIEIGTQQLQELERALEDEFQDLHLNLPILEVLAHALIYNAILDKYVESLELGKNGSAFVQAKMPTKMEDPELFTLPCRLGDSKPFDTLADLGFTKSYPVGIAGDVEVHIGRLKLLNEFYVIDMKKDPETPLLVGRGFLATANAVKDCRKAHLLEDKQIPSVGYLMRFLALGWLLEEIHVTWAHLKKKRTRLRLYIKYFEEIVHTKRGDGATNPKRRRQDFQDDGVRDLATTSERSRLKKALEESTWVYRAVWRRLGWWAAGLGRGLRCGLSYGWSFVVNWAKGVWAVGIENHGDRQGSLKRYMEWLMGQVCVESEGVVVGVVGSVGPSSGVGQLCSGAVVGPDEVWRLNFSAIFIDRHLSNLDGAEFIVKGITKGSKDPHLDEIIKLTPFEIGSRGVFFHMGFKAKATKMNKGERTP